MKPAAGRRGTSCVPGGRAAFKPVPLSGRAKGAPGLENKIRGQEGGFPSADDTGEDVPVGLM